MDIEEIKKYAKNKIEAGELTKQVRRQIKENTWEKQNQREGFTEAFKPLISQFEKPEDPKTKNIFTQNQEMLRNQLALTEGLKDNQLALTEGLKDNQKAIKQGFSQFERLADMKELPGNVWELDKESVIPEKDDQKDKEPKNILDLEKNFYENEIFTLKEMEYPRPYDFYDTSIKYLEKVLKDVSGEIKSLTSEIKVRNNTVNPSQKYRGETIVKEEIKKILKKYRDVIKDYFKSIKYKVGEGLFSSPQELLHRLELLNGSLAAGNNGVLPEYIQIAHRLRDHGIITNNQLSTLLIKVI